MSDSLPLLPLLLLGAVIVIAALFGKQRRKPWKRRESGGWKRAGSAGTGAAPDGRGGVQALPGFDASGQLRCVMAATFEKQPLLNKSEARVFFAAERAVGELNQGWRVMAQVSLGEILKSPDKAAYRAINSKRVDLLIIARNGDPLAAIEYQGGGHHQGTAAARDAVKREALRRAGIDYIEVKAGDSEADLKWSIAKLARGVPEPMAAMG